MVTDDGTRVQAEQDEDEEEENLDDNSVGMQEVVGSQSICRVCGKNLGERTVLKTEKRTKRAFLKLYDIDIDSDPEYFPHLLHRSCSQLLERLLKRDDLRKKIIPEDLPRVPVFIQRASKCTGCNQYGTGHNRSTCPKLSAEKSGRRKTKLLMDLNDRRQGNSRTKDWYDDTKKFCTDKGEDLKDLLAFTLRRVLYQEGLVEKAKNLEKVMKDESTSFDPLSPRSTWSRQVVSNRSYNQYRDDYKFGKQTKKQVLASPEKVDIEKHRISQKNVSFKLVSGEGEFFEYKAPVLPTKPTRQPNYRDLTKEARNTLWNQFRTNLKNYKRELRPNQIKTPTTIPESIRPSFIAVGNPYPNILAFSLNDIKEEIIEVVGKHPDLLSPAGVLHVDILGSDGCDGAAGYHMMSKPSDREIPDHALAYDFGITEVSASLENEKIVLYDSTKVSVFNLQPVLRAACNENDHYSTHFITIPIEKARELLCQSSMEIQLSDNITLKTKSIEIITSKVDKKYSDEQGGLGETNFPCHMCTASKEEIRDIAVIQKGFPIDRTVAKGAEIVENRRVNVDGLSQDVLKQRSKGWKSAPILTSEYIRRGFDDLHDCTSWGRWAIRIMVRLRAGIFSEIIDESLKPLFDTAKKVLRDEILRTLGIDIHLDLKGREAQQLFALRNHEKVLSFVPDEHAEDWLHFLEEARFALAIVCHPDPASQLDLKNAEPRLKRFQIWLVETWNTFKQPEYVHPTLMHLIQLLTRPGALRSISQYGTQNKEAKNQKNNQYLATMARRTDLVGALEDVYARDSQASSVEIRKHGESKPIHHCSKCGESGHRSPGCTGSSVRFNQKFLDLDQLDPLYRIRDKVGSDTDDSDEDFENEEECAVDDEDLLTPRKSVRFAMSSNVLLFEEDALNDSPAKRTRSKQKNVPTKEPDNPQGGGSSNARRRLIG